MTLKDQNDYIKANINDYEDWQIRDLIKQFHNYNANTTGFDVEGQNIGAYGNMIEYLENELANR